MAKSPAMNIQDSFLNQVRKDGAEVKIALLDGTTLVGTVRGFDNFTVILHSRSSQHLLYKHAIAQVIARRFSRRDSDTEEGRGAAASRPSPASSSPSASPIPSASPGPAASSTPAAPQDPKKGNAFNPIDLSGLHAEKDT